MIDILKALVDNNEAYYIATYRHLHAHPELSFEEYETSAFVQSELSKMGIQFRAGIAGTGILGVIEGKNPNKRTVALRADMDA